MVDKIAIIWALREMEFPYWCTKHNRIHKYGTNVWERDLDHVDIGKLTDNVKEIAILRRKQHDVKMKEVEFKHDITVAKHLKQEFEKRRINQFILHLK